MGIYVLRLRYGTGASKQANKLQAQHARRAGPIGLTVEERDFEHFPAKNGFPGIPVKAWIRFPNCAGSDVEGRAGDLPDLGIWVWSSEVTRREEMMNRNLEERTNRDSNNK